MIYGNRIRLRKSERADLPKYVAWLNDPEVRQGLMVNLPISMVEEENWFENMNKRPEEERPLAIEIGTGEGWELIGNAGLFQFNWRVRSAEFGIMIGNRNYWNKGYGTEATLLFLKHGFEALNLNRILLRVYASNQRAQRVYQKAGYKMEGTLRQAEYIAGEYVDVHLMSVLRSEWFAKEQASSE